MVIVLFPDSLSKSHVCLNGAVWRPVHSVGWVESGPRYGGLPTSHYSHITRTGLSRPEARIEIIIVSSYIRERNWYAPEPTSYNAAPFSIFRNFTPSACAAGLSDSVTVAASLAGT
jgi:hypothetical protein